MATDFQFDVSVDTKAAIKSIESFAASASKSVASIQSSFNALTAVAVAAIGVVAGGAVIKGLEDATKAANESETAFTKLQVALKLSGDFTQEASDDLVKFSKTLEGTTAISRNLIQAQIAQAKAFGLSNEEAKRLVKVAADLSAVTGDSLDSSVGKLTKSLGGQLGKLDDLGTSFKDLSKIQLLSGAAIDLVEKKFSGAAEALSGTFKGSTSQATNSFQALLSTIGQFITQNPVIISVIGSMAAQFSKFEAFLISNKKAINGFITSLVKGLVSIVPSVISVVREIVSALEPFVEILLQISSEISAAISEFLKLRVVQSVINLILKSIVGLGQTILLAGAGVNELIAAFLKISSIRTAINGVVKIVGVLVSSVAKVIGLLAQIPGVGSALKEIGIDAEELTTRMDSLAKETEQAADAFDVVNEAAKLEESNKGIFDLTNQLQNFKEALDVSPQIQQVSNSFKTLSETTSRAASQTGAFFGSVDSTLATVESSFQNVADSADAAGNAGSSAGKKIADSLQNSSDKASKFTGLLKELVSKALEAFSQTISISVDVAKADRDLQEFKARIPSILSGFEAEGQKVIQGLESKVSAQLDLVRLAATEEGKKKLENIEVEQKKKLRAIEQSAKLQVKRDIEAKERDFAAGKISAKELDDARVDIQTESNIKMAQDSEDLNLATEQLIQDTKIQNAKDIETAVNEKRKALEAEIAAARLKLEEDVAKKRFELQDELDKRTLENARKTEEAAARGAGQLIGAVTEYFVPGIGSAVGAIVTGLATGGDFLAKGLQNIIDALPVIFNNLFKALPQIIITLVEGVPDIIFAFINGLVNNISPIISAFASAMPRASIAFATALVKNAPDIALQLVKGIVEGIINAFIDLLNLIPFVDIPHVKLARGGEVPNGFMADNFPASLSTGELVVDRSTTGELKQFLANESRGGSGLTAERLENILTRTSEKNLSIVIKVGERDLAETLVALNRQGFRTV